jgi:hypothetical protein
MVLYQFNNNRIGQYLFGILRKCSKTVATELGLKGGTNLCEEWG